MFRLTILCFAVAGIVLSLTLGVLMVVPWDVSGILATASIGIPSLVLAYLSLKEKRKTEETEQVKTPQPLRQVTEPPSQPKTILEETCMLDTGQYVNYDFDLTEGEELKGRITSDEIINFYILSKYGLCKFENDEDFSYEYGSEGILKSRINFTPPKTGTWYLVRENEEGARATVTVHLSV